MPLRFFALLLLCLPALNAVADSFDINIHNDAVRLNYTNNMGGDMKGLELDAGLLYHETADEIYHLGLQVSGENWSEQGTFDIGLGGRLFLSQSDSADALAAGLGGEVRFSPVHRFGVGGEFYYAPDILAFMDSNGYREFSVRADYQLLPQAFVYLGYRSVKIEYEINSANHTVEVDDDLHVGMKLLF